ncbi:hypothetical protein HY383_01915 [Candidatus Daviesbacteria bacterium]|nr:hypothetical protein [Candidatus Daviesbacteria bacterium]
MSKLLIIFFTFSFLLFTPTSPVYAVCDPNAPIDKRSADCPAGLDQFEAMVGQLVFVIVGLGFIATLVMLVMAGFKYLTSGGEPKAIQAAHQTATWALLGILFMAVAWVLLQLIQGFTGIQVTIFDIKALCGVTGDPLKFCK